MAEKKEWKGITLNEVMLQGKILEDPTIVQTGDDRRCAFMSVRTFINELNPNGQWSESTVFIPLVVMDQRKVDVVEKFIKAERELFVKGYYKAWTDAQGLDNHGIIVTQMKLGSKGFPKRDEDVAASPSLD